MSTSSGFAAATRPRRAPRSAGTATAPLICASARSTSGRTSSASQRRFRNWKERGSRSSATARFAPPSRDDRASRLPARVAHEEVRRWIQAADVVCQPSLVEPFGQALLEAMASERSVLATVVGGPPEFVIPAAGVLVDPQDVAAIADGLRRAAELPSPNRAARSAAAAHDVNFQAARIEEILEQAARGRRA